jgi:alpha-L-fucosidase
MEPDLGSRDKLAKATSLVWYPSETDVSIRPGWFFHAEENKKVKSPEKLADIYFHSVGRNSVLLLNIPPDRNGLIHKRDIKSLSGLRKLLDRTFRTNLISVAEISHSGTIIEYKLPAPVTFNTALIQEDIKAGQRIEQFHLEAWNRTGWKTFAAGTTVGYKRIMHFQQVNSSRIRFVMDSSRAEPALMNIGLYQSPVGTSVD